MDHTVGEVVEIEGIARVEGEIASCRTTLGGTAIYETRNGALVLETPDGRVAIGGGENVIVPTTKRTGTWDEVAPALLKSHAASAPAPDVKITVETVEIRDGDRIRVRGRVTDLAASGEDGGNYRDAPATRIAAIEPDFIGIGDDREAAIAAAVRAVTPAVPRPPVFTLRRILVGVRVVTLIPLVLLLVRYAQHRDSVVPKAYMWIAAIAFAQIGTAGWYAARRSRIRVEKYGDLRFPYLVPKIMMLIMPVLTSIPGLLALADVQQRDSHDHLEVDSSRGFGLILLVFMLVPIALALPTLVQRRRMRRLLQPSSGWHVIEATTPNGYTDRDAKEMTIIRADGGRATIGIDDHVLLGAAEDFVDDGDVFPKIPKGGKVVVAGRAISGPRFAATQPGNVVVWGAPDKPREALDRAIAQEVRLIATLGAGWLAAAIALVVA